jgi:hypothetical protein
MTIKDPSSHPPEVEEVWWIHAKSKEAYTILEFGINESDLTPVVIYRKREGGPTWIRPALEFFDGRFSQAIRMKQ